MDKVVALFERIFKIIIRGNLREPSRVTVSLNGGDGRILEGKNNRGEPGLRKKLYIKGN